jgi:ribonucleoside-diphosphate reductase beta chain
VTLAGYDHLLTAAQRLQWDAEAIDLRPDAVAWPSLDPAARRRIGALIAGFRVAERAVAEHLAPFADAAGDDPVARECFLVQAGDERRHARFFTRVAAEVAGLEGDDTLVAPALRALFEAELPALAARLARGDATLTEAVGLYHLVLEGIVFAVGQRALEDELRALAVLPGTLDGILRVQADERWHVGLGVMCLQDRGRSVDVTAAAARAAIAWGPEIATPARVDAVLAVHGRRVAQVG